MNVDVTALKDGWHGDTSRTFEIGKVSVKAKNLVKTTFESMMNGINIIKEGVHLGDIGATIQNHVESQGFSVVQDFCGHGIWWNVLKNLAFYITVRWVLGENWRLAWFLPSNQW